MTPGAAHDSPLRRARERRGLSRKQFVEEFERAARRLNYGGLSVSERQIQRWEGIDPPRPRLAQARVLESIFGRPIAELGLPGDSDDFDITDYDDWTPVSTLALFDATDAPSRRDFLLSGATLSTFAFRYFSSGLMSPARSIRNALHIGAADIQAVRLAAGGLRQLDARIGSRPLIAAAREQTSAVFELLRNGSYSDKIGKELFAAAADAASITGWLLFDTGNESEAQHYFRLALRAARHADDDLMAVSVLAFMAIQQYNNAEWSDALALSRTALRLASRYDCPHVMASLYTREARALAGLGEAGGSYRSLDASLEYFDKERGSDHLATMDWVTEGELFGQASGCAALLGDVNKATTALNQARSQYPRDAHRSTSLHTLRLGLALAQAGEIEEACATASDALRVGNSVSSYRFDEVKGDLIYTLRRHAKSPYVIDLLDQHRPSLIDVSLPRSVHGRQLDNA